MTATALHLKPGNLPGHFPAAPAKQPVSRKITFEQFQKKYLSREDGFKYEWVDGEAEKTKRTMNHNQFYILRNLLRFFEKLVREGKADGLLINEGDIFFLENHRRPDIAWLSDAQIDRTAFGENQVPAFVLEVTSTTDAVNRIYKKMNDYRAAGVKVVWHIFPELLEVHVFAGENLDKMTVIRGEGLCSAAPVAPHFSISANDIFKMPNPSNAE